MDEQTSELIDAMTSVTELSLSNTSRIEALTIVLQSVVLAIGQASPQTAARIAEHMAGITASQARPAPQTDDEAVAESHFQQVLSSFEAALDAIR